MLLKCPIEGTGCTTVEAEGVAFRRVDRETGRIIPRIRADCHVGAVLIAAEGLRAEIALAVLAGTNRCALVL